MRHGVQTNSCGRDRTKHPLAGHRCCPENHGQGETELTDITDQVLVVPQKQGDPCAFDVGEAAVKTRWPTNNEFTKARVPSRTSTALDVVRGLDAASDLVRVRVRARLRRPDAAGRVS
jgi:hypothetical protein